MISCLRLEQPGRWRGVGISVLLLLVLIPAGRLLWITLSAPGALIQGIGLAFVSALHNSLVVAFWVALLALVLGLPAGVITALYEFPVRRMLTALVVLPILVPSFLGAIGWSSLTAAVAGTAGCVLVFSATAMPLVLLMSYAATRSLSGSQFAVVRLAGGEGAVLIRACGHAAVPAVVAAGFAGVLTLSDPGPGQILGLRTAAAEILTSFSALYDYGLAGRQCAVLTGVALLGALPLAWLAAPRIAAELMARQLAPLHRVSMGVSGGVMTGLLAVVVVVETVAPLVGLGLPLQRGFAWQQVEREILRTGTNSLLYAVGGGSLATVLGLLLAFCAGRGSLLRLVCIVAAVAMFSLPPAFAALGCVELVTHAPAWADPVFRGRAVVWVALGLRFFPIAALLALRAWGSTSATWTQVAGMHGVSLASYLYRVLLPVLLPAAALSVLLVALLAAADVGTVLILHPPGEPSFPLAIFTIMANAPESLVASLCITYVAGTAGLLLAVWSLAARGSRS